jgi:DNA repair photolyase
MRQTIPDFAQALALAAKVDEQYRPAWKDRTAAEQVSLALYFLPHGSAKPQLAPTRPRVIKWYCPFACQSEFPSGHRYCINVYTGCAHLCEYCYAVSYAPSTCGPKKLFERMIQRDLEDMEGFDVPPAPVHLSNSTDPFQPLEAEHRHTQYALEQILAHRHRFTTVTILTKNPSLAAQPEYRDLLRNLASLLPNHPRHEDFTKRGEPGCCVEVSLAFWREEARAAYDVQAPTIEDRKEGIRALRRAGIPVVLRIDPLFPRSPLKDGPRRSLSDFGLCEAQTAADLHALVSFAKEVGARHVVYSPVKIVQPRSRRLSETMQALRAVYAQLAAPGKLDFHSGSWRLPHEVARTEITGPFLEICRSLGVKTKYCMQNLIETP